MKKILILFLFFTQLVSAQKAVDFESEDYYYIKRSQHLKITLNKEKFSIVNDVFERAK